jgi:nitroreductase
MNNNDQYPIAQVLKARRTIRQFKSDSVPLALIVELMNIANWAPNHGLREAWRFILYHGESRLKFAEAVIGALSAEERTRLGDQRLKEYTHIPIHLIVVMKEDSRQKQWDEDYGAACCWIQNLQLAAWERGLGVVWKTNTYSYAPAFREAVGISGGEKVVGVLHVGYPAVIPEPRPRKSAEQQMIIHG